MNVFFLFVQVMAVHSQSSQVPDCPRGWQDMWIGFSFAMVSIHYYFPCRKKNELILF